MSLPDGQQPNRFTLFAGWISESFLEQIIAVFLGPVQIDGVQCFEVSSQL